MANEHPKFEDYVPQFSRKINDKFVEWLTDVRLWGAEHKDDTRPRFGPSLNRIHERTTWTAEADRQDIVWSGRPRKLRCGEHTIENAQKQWLHS